MSKERLDILFPVGRLVAGSLYTPRTTDSEGRPLLYKHGTNAGQPRKDFSFGLAIPKGAETSWSQTPWGEEIYNFAVRMWPNGQTQRNDFSWKIEDGDSQIPNKKNIRPCDREGWPGNWIVFFSSAVAPRIYNADATQQLTEPDAVKPGYFIEVFGNIASNESTQTSGIYINHSMVALAGYGEVIQFGPDPSAVGFGKQAKPAGAMATPPGGMAQPAPAPAQPAPAPAPVAPATGFADGPAPEKKYLIDGRPFAESTLRQAGWTDEHLAQYPVVQ